VTTDRFDLVVVGAGPAGCAAAVAAARTGARVLVLDRARFPRPKTCGDAISNRAAEIVADLVRDTEPLRGVPHARVDTGVAIFPGGASIVRDFGAHPGFIVPRLGLDDHLRRAMQAQGPELREGVAVRGLVEEHGRIVGVQTEAAVIRAGAIIAADGPGSVGWTALGVPYHRDRRLAVALTASMQDVRPGPHRAANEHYFEPGLRAGYGWIFPPVEGLANVGVYQRADRFHAHGRSLRQLFDAFVTAHPERFDGARVVGKTRVWALPLATLPGLPGMPGLLLAGDAGRYVDPLAGEGIWQALHSGRLAGQAAAAALAGAGLGRAAVDAYRRRCALDIGLPSVARMGVQDAMDVILATGLHRQAWVRAVLGRGYGSERLEASKRLR
jgi:geranylgeranyl reductase family protein